PGGAQMRATPERRRQCVPTQERGNELRKVEPATFEARLATIQHIFPKSKEEPKYPALEYAPSHCGEPAEETCGPADTTGHNIEPAATMKSLNFSSCLTGGGALRMFDLHCHILPGVDDGAASLEEAIAMARFCVRDGITHIAATPHCNRYTRLLRADILPHVAGLNAELAEAGVPLTVLPGSEVQVIDSALYRREFEAGLYCHLGAGCAFTLLEFNWNDKLYPPDAPELVTWLRRRGTTPIVAHPERHGFFGKDPARLRALVDAGAWL